MVTRDEIKASRCREVGVQLLIVPYFEKNPEALLRSLLRMASLEDTES